MAWIRIDAHSTSDSLEGHVSSKKWVTTCLGEAWWRDATRCWFTRRRLWKGWWCSLKCSYAKSIDIHVYIYILWYDIHVFIYIYTETSHSAYVDSTLWKMAGTPRTDGLPLRESSFRSEGLGFLKENSPIRRWVFFQQNEGMLFCIWDLRGWFLMIFWVRSSWCFVTGQKKCGALDVSAFWTNKWFSWPQAASEGQHFSTFGRKFEKIGCRQPFISRKSSILPDSWDPSPRSDSSEDSVNLARLGSKYSKQIRENPEENMKFFGNVAGFWVYVMVMMFWPFFFNGLFVIQNDWVFLMACSDCTTKDHPPATAGIGIEAQFCSEVQTCQHAVDVISILHIM